MRYKKLKIGILIFLGLILGVHVILLLSGWYSEPVLYCSERDTGAIRDRDSMEADNLVIDWANQDVVSGYWSWKYYEQTDVMYWHIKLRVSQGSVIFKIYDVTGQDSMLMSEPFPYKTSLIQDMETDTWEFSKSGDYKIDVSDYTVGHVYMLVWWCSEDCLFDARFRMEWEMPRIEAIYNEVAKKTEWFLPNEKLLDYSWEEGATGIQVVE